MKILIPLKRDSENTYPSAELEFTTGSNTALVHIKVSDAEREIAVNREDLLQVLTVLKNS